MSDVKRRVCPLCGKTYKDVPALSRRDNRTEICPLCGVREALVFCGLNKEETERILEVIKRITAV